MQFSLYNERIQMETILTPETIVPDICNYFEVLISSYANCWFSHDVTKMQTKKLSILPRFYFHDALE